MNDFTFLDPENQPADRAEWDAAWAGMLRLSGDRDFSAQCPETGEVWQYMGTCIIGGRWHHDFRHRNHPATDQRVYLHVPASPDWRPREQARAA